MKPVHDTPPDEAYTNVSGVSRQMVQWRAKND
jgi:hypothetical protein